MSEVGEAQAPKRVWTVYLLFVTALLAMLFGSMALLAVVWAVLGNTSVPSGPDLAALAARPDVFIGSIWVTGAVLGGATLSAAGLSKVPWKTRLSLRRPAVTPVQIIMAAIGLPALSVLIETVVLVLGIEVSGSLKMITDTIAHMKGLQIPMVVFAISFVPGIGEELLFRGYIQTRLVRRHGALVGILVSSVLFGIMHMDKLHSPLTAVMGLYLGFLAVYFRSIWPAVAAHTLNNAVSAFSVVLSPDEPQPTEPNWIAAGIALVIFGAVVAYFRRIGGRIPPVNTSNSAG